MLIKAMWIVIVAISVVGFIFFASLGITIPEAYYEKQETLIAISAAAEQMRVPQD